MNITRAQARLLRSLKETAHQVMDASRHAIQLSAFQSRWDCMCIGYYTI